MAGEMWGHASATPENNVKIEGRYVQLELGPDDRSKESNPFEFSYWTWRLSVRRDAMSTFLIQLSTVPPGSREVAASVSLTFMCFPEDGNKPPTVHYPPAIDGTLSGSFTWTMADCGVPGRCLAEICFNNIRFVFVTDSGLGRRIWPEVQMGMCSRATGNGRMLREGIFTDITINAVGGSIRAHRAVLGACSPVFLSMLSHDPGEKALSAVDIPDMSIGACRAFIGYLYGDASEEELVAHRSELVAAGDKYGVGHLKSACERSMIKDVDTGNVRERLSTRGRGCFLCPLKGETMSRYAQSSASSVLRGDILTDITLNAVGGSVRAHRAVLGAWSPVILCMFSQDFREKALSAVDIPDMSIGACRAFVSYFYGEASEAELMAHRLELVAAGEKYGVDRLKWMCARSLMEDVVAGNVLERLQTAHLYQLQELKKVCIRLLLEFEVMYEIPEDFDAFMRAADKDLVAEIKKSWRHVLRSKHKSCYTTPDQDQTEASGDGARAKRARRPNVRLAGGEWAK